MPPANPFALPNPFDVFGQEAQARQPSVPYLAPEEEQSLLSSIGSGALHGLGWIGGSLSKAFGGRAIRGLLGGKPHELLSAIPWSDTLGVTDPGEEVHGSELLTGQKDVPFFSPEGIAGFGVDVLTDPATYLSFGGSALSPLGRAAAKAGVKLPATGAAKAAGFAAGSPEAASMAGAIGGAATPASVAGKALGGHVGLGLPFGENLATFNLAPIGNVVSKIPGFTPALNYASETLSPVYRGLGGLFRGAARGQTDPVLQDLAIAGTQKMAGQRAEAAMPFLNIAQERMAAIQQKLGPGWTPAHQAEALTQGRLLADAIERTPHDWNALDPAVRATRQTELSVMDPQLVKWAKDYRAADQPYLQRGLDLGLYDSPLAGGPEHMHRQSTFYESKIGGRGPMTMTPAEQQARKEMFQGLYTNQINEMAVDDTIRAMSPDAAAQAINARYFGGDPARLEQAKQLARWQGGLNAGVAKEVGGYFVNDPLADVLHSYIPKQVGRFVNAEDAYTGLARLAQQGGEIPINAMLGKMNLNNSTVASENLIKALMAERGMTRPEAEIAFGAHAAGGGMGVSRAQEKALTKYVTPPQAYPGAGPVMSAIDSLVNLTKAGQTSWPSTIFRNLGSDIYSRFAFGGSPVAPMAAGKAFHEGRVIPGIAERIPMFKRLGLTDEQAMGEIAKLEMAHGISNMQRFQAAEASGIDPAMRLAQRNMPAPGAPGVPLGEAMRSHLPGAEDVSASSLLGGTSRLLPWNIRGVGGRQASGFTPVGMAQSSQNYLESVNRSGTFIDALERGYSPAAAAQQVALAHKDFSNLSQFERDVARRIIPYYGWLRANTPDVISEIASNPGGRMAQTVRGVTSASTNQFLPEAVSQTGMAIPAGEPENGRQRYLTSLGLPFEDLANLTSIRGLVGAANPLIRAPFELATGRQAFSGRDVPANFPLEGQTANVLAMASPLSRVFSAANAVGRQDPLAAAFQLGLGPRLTSVQEEPARQQAIRSILEERLRQLPEVGTFNRLYVRPDQMQNLSPEELMLYRLYATEQRRANQAARSR